MRGRIGRGTLLAAAVAVVIVALLVVVIVSRSGNGEAPGAHSPTNIASRPVPTFSASGSAPITPSERTLLTTRGGFGGQVTGGAGGAIVHVTSDADSGPGSLRDALAGARPTWIVFDSDMTIDLTSPLALGDDVTIDGRGHAVKITGPGHDGFDLIDDSNVIIESLTLSDFGDPARTAENDTPDAIHLDHATGVWIDHCDLSHTGDKLIAVSDGSSGITVSRNRFHDQEQVMQVGNQATAAQDAQQTVTVDYNYFDRTGYRNPVVSYGYAHVFDNYYFDWQSYAVRAEREGRMLLQDNIFYAGDNTRATSDRVHANGCNDTGTRCDSRPGVIVATGNLLLNGARIPRDELGSPSAAAPSDSYRYHAEPASKSLSLRIVAAAGPQG